MQTLIETLQREARENNAKDHRAEYGGILPEEALQKAIAYWDKRTDILIADTVRRAYEEGAKRERERFLELLETHRNDVLWADENSNEVMRISIKALIEAVKSDLTTPTETLPPQS